MSEVFGHASFVMAQVQAAVRACKPAVTSWLSSADQATSLKKVLALNVHFLLRESRYHKMQEPSELAVMHSCGCLCPICILFMAPLRTRHASQLPSPFRVLQPLDVT